MKRFFGAHVSSSGGLVNALTNGDQLGVNTIQIHPSPPQRWNSKPYPPGYEDEFNEARSRSKVEKVFFHGVYLINLANPDPLQAQNSKNSLVHYLDLMNRIDGEGVIFHVGSMKDESDEAVGYRRVAAAIDWILERAPGESRLLLEVAAGSGKIIGDRVEELRTIYDEVKNQERVGFALDTQHLWASGYDLTNELDQIVANIGEVLCFEKIGAIHINDSKTELGSRKDRHENIGDGLIGGETLKRVFLRPEFRSIPFILETPHLKELQTAAIEVEKLKGFLG